MDIEKRRTRGINTIFKELALEDSGGFSEYMRMPHTINVVTFHAEGDESSD